MAVFDRLGSIQFDPIEIAGRNHDLVLLARVAGYRREMTDRAPVRGADAVRDLQQGPLDRPDRGAAVVSGRVGPGPRQHEGGAFDEHAPLVAELLDRIGRPGRCRRSTSSRGPRSSGRGGRRTRSGRSSRASPRRGSSACRGETGNRRVYDLVERLFPAEVLGQVGPDPGAVPPQAPVALPGPRSARAIGQHGALARTLAVARHRDGGRAAAQDRRAARSSMPSSWPTARSCRWTVEGIRGPRYVPAEELPRLEQEQYGAACCSTTSSGLAETSWWKMVWLPD